MIAKIYSLMVFLCTLKYREHLRLVFRESVALAFALVRGTRTWILMAARLIIYTLLLMPGWMRMLSYWLFDDGVLRNVEFGKGSLARNVLDVYLPINSSVRKDNKILHKDGEGAPVVIFVGGGVWIIGNKLWSTLVARGLTMLGYLVIVPDYRNFPQGGIEEMCDDLTSCLMWTVETCWHYGGNKEKLTLAGQSAGAHIALCTILRLFEGKAIPESKSPIAAVGEDPLRVELSALLNDSYPSDHVDFGSSPLLQPDSPGFFNRIYAPERKSPIVEASFSLEEELQPLGRQQPREEQAEADFDASAVVSSSEDESEDLTWTEIVPSWGQRKAHSRKGSQSSTPKSSSYRSGSSDSLDGDFIYFMGGAAGANGHGVEAAEATAVNMEAARDLALLRAVKQLVLINGPFDLCSLQSHLHSRGLDSQILRWIFRSDFEHYSPTRRVHELAKKVPPVAKSEGLDRELCWDNFPAVAILSCLEDKSIPVDQARGLYRALASATNGDSSDGGAAVGVCLVEYTGLSHTSLVVEGPLEGDPTLFRDFDDILRLVDARGKLALSSFTSLSAYSVNKKMKQDHLYTPMVPPSLVGLAKRVNPF